MGSGGINGGLNEGLKSLMEAIEQYPGIQTSRLSHTQPPSKNIGKANKNTPFAGAN